MELAAHTEAYYTCVAQNAEKGGAETEQDQENLEDLKIANDL